VATVIAAVILAAGRSERLGRPKQLLPHRGRTLLRHAVDCARDGGCDPVIVVLGAAAESVRSEFDDGQVVLVTNEAWREGIGSSVRAGVEAVVQGSSETRAVLLLTCDQPRITARLVRRLRQRFEAGDTRIVACEYAGTVGVPAVFERSLFPELLALSGAVGAKPLLETHAASLARLPWPDGVVDIDHPEDCDQLE
jgi:molybdenum cofactor cytidylyltransferase